MKNNLSTIEDIENPEYQAYLSALKASKDEVAKLPGNEDNVNAHWREIEALELNADFIRVFALLKAKEYRSAWDLLERCEIACKFLIKNSSSDFQQRKRVSFIEEMIEKYQSLFPYCVFVSPGFKVGYYTCGICGHKVRPRSRCEHQKGIVYNGKLCLHEGHDLEPIEISIVNKPVQKYSVMHNDSTLDFSVLEYLVSSLHNVFEPWDYEKKTMSFPREKFSMFSSNDLCPCKSGSIFSSCCEHKSEIEIPHIDFYFSRKSLHDENEIRFPY
ncbi:zinc chelation protein SecC [Vibrio vulnificus]|uniref:SEC-C motif domain protein n=1 Tax=Vibrio vulnificus TaxID=672 RepID=A0AAN1UBS4_VIBVL|nr:zinc chelation protein SecC [Vibrio vulnificus]AXX59650.1 SEC-C motif domain protein [Vibrio vulnificus]